MQEQCGASMVRCLNLETKRALFVHINDLKVYQRPCATDWKLNDKTKAELCAKLDFAWTDFDELFLNDSWKNKQAFVDIGKAADLEVIFAKALKE